MPQTFEAEDIGLHRTLSGVTFSEARQAVACAVRYADLEKNAYVSDIWLVSLDGDVRPLTFGGDLNTSPAWSPSGSHLAFVSNRTGSLQIHLLPMDGGDAAPLGSFAQGVQNFWWSPDGKRLLVLATVSVDPDKQDAADAEDAEGCSSDDPEVVWHLPYKSDGIGYVLRHRLHLFTIDIASGEKQRVTRGAFNVGAACWSPDGRRIAYSRTREGRFGHRTDIWVCHDDGSHAMALTKDTASSMSPAWSPDGSTLVFFGATADGDPLSRPWCIDLASKQITPLAAEELEIAAGAEAQWQADSAAVVVVLADRGMQTVARVTVDDGSVERLITGDRQVSQLQTGASTWVYRSEFATRPEELYLNSPDGRSERRFTSFNAWSDDRTEARAEYRQFDVPDGAGGTERFGGWLLRPADAKGPTPLLVDMHGGPASYVLLDAAMHPYWPMLCSRGWTVLSLNAAGSGSYGQEFADRLHSRWGELDLPQHLSAVETLQAEGLADDRVAVIGKSYGGYLSAWAIGHTRVFRAAVISAPVTNLETHFGTSDGGYYADPYSMKAEPYLDRELSQRLSPMKHADKSVTPTLILQGKEDERCPKCQSEELYVTLMCSGDSPVQMVLYPGEGHHFLETGKPSYRVDIAKRMVGWLQRWIDVPLAASAPPDPVEQSSMPTLQTHRGPAPLVTSPSRELADAIQNDGGARSV